jgi:hypothetical protein
LTRADVSVAEPHVIALLDDCYRRGRYASLDYNRPLNPPLREDEKRWVEQLLKGNGAR